MNTPLPPIPSAQLSDDFYLMDLQLERQKLATHVHLKSGGLYRVLHRGQWEKTLEHVVVYEAVFDWRIWVRPSAEFDDKKRFAVLDKRPQ
jgi:hypothetical protein